MEGCYTCGRAYDDSFADWTICRPCMIAHYEQQEFEDEADEYTNKKVYMDSLGISWSQAELDEAGGLHEVIRLNNEARV